MRLTIRTKLLAGFTIILLLLITAAFIVMNKLSESNERLENIVDVSSEKINISNEILVGILNVTRHEKNLILEKDPAAKQEFIAKMNRYIEVVELKIPELLELADEKGKPIVNELKSNWKAFIADIDTIKRLSLNGKDEAAFDISAGRALKFREESIRLMEQIIRKNEEAIALDKTENTANYSSSVDLIIALIITSLVIAVLISYWIIQSIVKRIAFISSEAEKISSREHSGYRLEDQTKDELRPIFISLTNINESFREITENANQVASGNYDTDIVPRSEKDSLGQSLKKMTQSLRETTAENEKHNWLTTGQNLLNEKMRGDKSIEDLSTVIIGFLSHYLHCQVGAVYLTDDSEKSLLLRGHFALDSVSSKKTAFSTGEGLIGQAALEKNMVLLSDIDEQHIRITSSVIDAKPSDVLILPFGFEGKILGVIELGKLGTFNETEKEFLRTSAESIGISINSAIARKRIQQLLEETQVQSEELQSQQEELKQMNEELEEQAQNLKQQQEELQMTNEELEEQTQSLEIKNKEVEAARTDIEQKTKQLELSSRYKSEFLANMSHELRTPLNSLLILSKDLAENSKKNLSQEQVESAEIIHKSGQDLLGLINEVLDLSKIEAGKMTLTLERLPIKEFAGDIIKNFRHQAERKGLKLIIQTEKGIPEAIRTDSRRLDQVIKNLLSNAIKFTEKGNITVTISPAGNSKISVSIADTGIGIPKEKQAVIFEAFQQGDGSTSRKYGGTGLGLSISRELTRLLGGEISLTSTPNEGSVFTLVIPVELQDNDLFADDYEEKETTRTPSPKQEFRASFINYPAIDDDRKNISDSDKVVLIIEDDLNFAGVLYKQAHQKGFKCLAASTGEDGLILAEQHIPHAIILDIDLPGIDGHKVLAELKANTSTRHIPVHIISVNERTIDTIKEGAIEYLTKPVDKKQLEKAFGRIEDFIERKMKNLLIIEDDDHSRKAMKKLIGNGDVKCFEAASGKEALDAFEKNHIDCIVLDLGLPDISGFELIYKMEKIKEGKMPPIIIYTGRELTREENNELQKYAETIIIKGVKSEERLLDETALFLHRTIRNLPESKQKIITGLYDKESIFHNKKILVVDDDMRNVFALSKILKERGMKVSKAENGIIALETLDKQPDMDLVLMDIMMPEMDGYEAMRKIRQQSRFLKLPVIALTAKAMKDDKKKCIEAGASDYITKPVEIDRLLSLMRVWLSK